jgi:hypothetical protein
MTIFTSKVVEKKEDGKAMVPPEPLPEYKLLKKAEPASVPRGKPYVTVVERLSGFSQRTKIIGTVVLFLLMVVLLLFFVWLLQVLPLRRKYSGVCGVHYHQKAHKQMMFNDDEVNFISALGADNGEFEQHVNIDDYQHESIEVPSIGSARRATVLHDFIQNITVIVDREQSYCFLMPLNRSLVVPPRDFWDLLVKLKTGYYIPDVDVVRENYRAVTPPIEDLSPYGYNVYKECNTFNTYQLVPEGQPFAMSKRSACELVGNKFCLGDAGAPRMLCININSCV